MQSWDDGAARAHVVFHWAPRYHIRLWIMSETIWLFESTHMRCYKLSRGSTPRWKRGAMFANLFWESDLCWPNIYNGSHCIHKKAVTGMSRVSLELRGNWSRKLPGAIGQQNTPWWWFGGKKRCWVTYGIVSWFASRVNGLHDRRWPCLH